MNVLFTCAGRRNYLIEYFRNVVAGNGVVVGADTDFNAPALQECDVAYRIPPVYADDYIDSLMQLCSNEKIDLLIPLNDLELPVLAEARQSLTEIGVVPLISDAKLIDICFDKYKTSKWCMKAGIRSPITYLSLADANAGLDHGEVAFPLIVKPRRGTASTRIYQVNSPTELEDAYRLSQCQNSRGMLARASNNDGIHRSVLIQEMIHGTEYGLDVLNDFEGRPRCVCVKEKLAKRSGETDKSCLRNIPRLTQLGKDLGRALGHVGNLDCDVFMHEEEVYVLEFNPRFGGGYPFSHCAGANYPAAILAWLAGDEYDVTDFEARYDVVFSKADRLLQIQPIVVEELPFTDT